MQNNHEGLNEETANGLLLLVSGDGIPLLVRTYGEVHTPPSAAVGIVSALFHAAKREKSGMAEGAGLRLLALESTHRTIVYETTALDFLLVFASDKSRNACKPCSFTRRMLRTVFAALSMLIGERNLRNWDSSRLRAAIAKQIEVVDAIVARFRIDPRFIFGRPVCDALAHWQLNEGDIGDDKRLLQGMWLDNGVLVGEFSLQDSPIRLNAGELLVLIIMGECVARRDCDYTYHVARTNVARIQTDVKVVICNSSRAPLTTFIGVFTDQTTDDEALRTEVRCRHLLALTVGNRSILLI
ncbi:hypothetical protein BBJ28_00003063 [Nothophytophthora sp. Chile5]|nr:hypothetical protein BBJ28_00003063 [Nothophytophthora sp. Chile5]